MYGALPTGRRGIVSASQRGRSIGSQIGCAFGECSKDNLRHGRPRIDSNGLFDVLRAWASVTNPTASTIRAGDASSTNSASV